MAWVKKLQKILKKSRNNYEPIDCLNELIDRAHKTRALTAIEKDFSVGYLSFDFYRSMKWAEDYLDTAQRKDPDSQTQKKCLDRAKELIQRALYDISIANKVTDERQFNYFFGDTSDIMAGKVEERNQLWYQIKENPFTYRHEIAAQRELEDLHRQLQHAAEKDDFKAASDIVCQKLEIRKQRRLDIAKAQPYDNKWTLPVLDKVFDATEEHLPTKTNATAYNKNE